MTMENADSYENREKRITDAIGLRVPDRVPITASFYFFPARYYGYTAQQIMYDMEVLIESHVRATLEFRPDLAQNPVGLLHLGPVLDALDYRQMQWPGRQLAPDVPFQFVEGEYMTADEYDHFFSDPADFILRKYWPRISGALKPLEGLPPLSDFLSYMGLGVAGFFANPAMRQPLAAMIEAGEEMERIGRHSQQYEQRMVQEGFPTQKGGMASAPFDVLGDVLRGTKGLMLDMYRRPDTVLKAVERLLPLEISRGITSARRGGGRYVHIPLHKGLDGFMSPEQFKKFFWPTLKELIIALVNEGLTPHVFWEGDCTSRLGFIGDVPPGKCIYRFEATDIMKAKDALRDKVCIRGNVPISILSTANPEDVKAYCKKLIDYVGKGGGFIMDAAASVNDALPENLRAMFDFTREYGIY
jgi:hypothetical protein